MSRSQTLIRRQAPCMARCFAFIIDGCITPCFLCFAPLYALFKDGIRDGQSFGKGMMGLRVVNFTTGRPASLGSSCIRNFCACCPLLLLITPGRRRFGDYVAGTIVVKDR